MTAILKRLGREPVLIGAALLAWLDVVHPSDLVKAAAVANIAVFVRAYSSPKAAVEESKQVGYDQAVADVSTLAPRVPPPPIKRPVAPTD
jgi:hypothetical protein